MPQSTRLLSWPRACSRGEGLVGRDMDTSYLFGSAGPTKQIYEGMQRQNLASSIAAQDQPVRPFKKPLSRVPSQHGGVSDGQLRVSQILET